jgi:hypothetical protein
MSKKNVHMCRLGAAVQKGSRGSKTEAKPELGKEELVTVYNKFYREQLSALYRVIHSGK